MSSEEYDSELNEIGQQDVINLSSNTAVSSSQTDIVDDIFAPEIKRNIRKLFMGELLDLTEQPIIKYKERIDQLFHTVNTNERYGRSIIIDFQDALFIDMNLDIPIDQTFQQRLINYPELVISQMDVILRNVLQEIYHEESLALQPLYIRFNNINPNVKGIEEFRSDKNGKMIEIKGTVLSMTKKRSVLVTGKYYCEVCKRRFDFKQPYKYQYKAPACTNERCSQFEKPGKHISFDPDASKPVDYQIITIQNTSIVGNNAIEAWVECIARDDIVDSIESGDDVSVTGIFKILPTFAIGIDKFGDPEFKQTLYISNIQKIMPDANVTYEFNEEDFKAKVATPALEEAWVEEAKSIIAPSIYGLDHLKEAILLMLYSGSTHVNKDGTIRHGNINLLFITDPGMGKTSIANSIRGLCNKYQYVSAQSASSAGMTAAVVKDGNGPWTIVAGATVLANKGVCVADEFDKMSREDMTKLHEQLQNRTVTVHKAGIHKVLSAECDVLALANPAKNRFIPELGLSKNLDKIPPSLYNRFDLIFIVQDKMDQDNDRNTIRHIIKNSLDISDINSFNQHYNIQENASFTDYPRKVAFLRDHIKYMKSLCNNRYTYDEMRQGYKPIKMTLEASEAIENFFVEIRSPIYQDKESPIPINNRSGETLTKLASARAKMFGRDSILKRDVDAVIRLYRRFLDDIYKDPETGVYDSTRVEQGMSYIDANLGEYKHVLVALNELRQKEEYRQGVTEEEFIDHMIAVGIVTHRKNDRESMVKTANKILFTLKSNGSISNVQGKLQIPEAILRNLPNTSSDSNDHEYSEENNDYKDGDSIFN